MVGSAGVGVMASLYGSKVTEGGMTLELSLEINKKLQVGSITKMMLRVEFRVQLPGSIGGHFAEEHHPEGQPEHLG